MLEARPCRPMISSPASAPPASAARSRRRRPEGDAQRPAEALLRERAAIERDGLFHVALDGRTARTRPATRSPSLARRGEALAAEWQARNRSSTRPDAPDALVNSALDGVADQHEACAPRWCGMPAATRSATAPASPRRWSPARTRSGSRSAAMSSSGSAPASSSQKASSSHRSGPGAQGGRRRRRDHSRSRRARRRPQRHDADRLDLLMLGCISACATPSGLGKRPIATRTTRSGSGGRMRKRRASRPATRRVRCRRSAADPRLTAARTAGRRSTLWLRPRRPTRYGLPGAFTDRFWMFQW